LRAKGVGAGHAQNPVIGCRHSSKLNRVVLNACIEQIYSSASDREKKQTKNNML